MWPWQCLCLLEWHGARATPCHNSFRWASRVSPHPSITFPTCSYTNRRKSSAQKQHRYFVSINNTQQKHKQGMSGWEGEICRPWCFPRHVCTGCFGKRPGKRRSNHMSSGSPRGRACPRVALEELRGWRRLMPCSLHGEEISLPMQAAAAPGSSCSSSEGKGWRGLLAFANTVNKMLILCLTVVSLSLVTCSYGSRC